MLNSLVYGERTARPDLLVAHGLFGSARNWGVMAKGWAASRRVVVVDMRNHGASPWFDEQSYPAMADDLAELITAPMDVLGHSMGGKAAMVLALKYPHKINKLVVGDIAPVGYAHSQMGPINAMRGVDLAKVSTRADALEMLGDLEPAVAAFLLQSLDIKEKRWRLNLDVLAAEMDRIVGFPQLDVAPCPCPALFLSGAQSPYVLPDHRPTIKSLFPNAKFAKVKDAGHWLHAEKPREVAAAVLSFLDAETIQN